MIVHVDLIPWDDKMFFCINIELWCIQNVSTKKVFIIPGFLFSIFQGLRSAWIGFCTRKSWKWRCRFLTFIVCKLDLLKVHWICMQSFKYIFVFGLDGVYSVSQKIPPLRTCDNFSKTIENFSTKFYARVMRSHLH